MKRLKGLGGLGKLKGLGPTNAQLPTLEDDVPRLDLGQEDPAVEEIWRVMGGRNRDLKLARQAATLQQRLPYATTPELVTYLWLKEKGVNFEFQAEANGGRRQTGGSVIDFLVHTGNNWAWRIQGTFWHNLTEQQHLDEVRRKLLEGATVMGYQIDGVVDIWEHRLYQDREQVLTLALAGIQVGQ
jgi:hypothetical protein